VFVYIDGLFGQRPNQSPSLILILLYLSLHFESQEDLENGEDVATCPSCSLVIKVIYNIEDIESICVAKLKKTNSSNQLITN